MKSYVINLKKDTEKLKRCIDGLKPLGITPERFDAVYGKELHPEYIKSILHTSAQKTLKDGRLLDKDIGNLGAVGCYLSHTFLWKKILEDENEDETFLIFEDDALPSVSKEELHDYIKTLPKNWDIVFLGFTIPTLMNNNDERVGASYKINNFLWGTHAYLLNKKGAEKLISTALPIVDQVDSYIILKCMDGSVEGYRPEKSMIDQDLSLESGIMHNFCLKCYMNRLDIEILVVIIIIFLILLFFFIKKVICPLFSNTEKVFQAKDK